MGLAHDEVVEELIVEGALVLLMLLFGAAWAATPTKQLLLPAWGEVLPIRARRDDTNNTVMVDDDEDDDVVVVVTAAVAAPGPRRCGGLLPTSRLRLFVTAISSLRDMFCAGEPHECRGTNIQGREDT